MSDQNPNSEEPQEPIRFTDKRRFDPETGEPRNPEDNSEAVDPIADPLAQAEEIFRDLPVEDAESVAEGADAFDESEVGVASAEGEPTEQAQVAELQADLQRLQAEYVNYRRRVERDRVTERDRTVGQVISDLMPVLDDISAARQAGDLEDGPFAHIANRLESVLSQRGLERIDEVGVPFDPNVHEAIMQQPTDDVPADHVAIVVRSGYRHGDRLLRAGQVIVSSGPAE